MSYKDIVVFPWNRNFETGIEAIDDQHKELVSILNQLANTLVYDNPVEVSAVFKKLADYASYHFTEEEKIWNEYFPEDAWINSHSLSHSSFLPNVMKIKEGASDRIWQDITESIIQFLIRWLAFHILDDDKKMSFVVQGVMSGKSFSEAKNSAEKQMKGSTSILIETVLSMYDELSSHAIELIRERHKRVKVEEELRTLNDKLEQIAITDELSGLFNRRYFNMMIDTEMQRAIRDQRLLSFIALDLDHFKSINDSLGHSKGDEAIMKVSATVSSLCKRAGDFVFRIGGEEFLVVVSGSSTPEVFKLAEQIRESIEKITISHTEKALTHQLTTSIGVFSQIPQLGDDYSVYLNSVDEALYKAKSSGRNMVV